MNVERRRPTRPGDLGKSFFVHAGFRWIFPDEPSIDNSNIEDEEFDYGQVTLGLSLRF